MRSLDKRQSGFTLVEMIIVIVITGIIGGIVAMFIKAPVQGYVDSARRAELTDIADAAVRRMARDVRTAVPNSVRIANCGAIPCVEFLPTKDGGRYRVEPRPDGTGDVLNFGAADIGFDIIGSQVKFGAGDQIVIGSTQSSGNLPYDTTAGAGILRPYNGAIGTALSNVVITNPSPGFNATAALPSQRFDVVDGTQQAVTYACVVPAGGACATDASGNGTCQLKRYWKYGFNPAQVNPPVGAGLQTSVLADKVSACAIAYDFPNQRFGLVAVRLTLSSGGESVTLYNEVHVNNAP